MAEETATADVLNQQAQAQLKSIVDRLERLDVERAEITEQFNEVLKEAHGNGYCKKTLRKVVRALKIDRAKRAEDDAMLDLYLGTVEGTGHTSEPVQRADTSLGIATVTLTMENGSAVAATPDQMAAALAMIDGTPEDEALYAQAVALVRRDGKPSTSYVQRCLQLGYNRAAAIMERMEAEGIVGPPNHAGARVILQAEAV
jgi:uncharacterized protein (UPF0335 family)